ncbi:RluA family pseudouridine synthase [Patescibacteria group bacterium]|nr:RluA family pseudouridine synthase [Patescibacteria group bacterium]MBU1673186.1 RluA family pseudouridine synthase [Patescibacteria group bacterium]MBU1963034.1 RluA family pseudouridine synthase [Patescibacteria group bacterium]
MKIKITDKDQGQRLDKFLVARFPDISRTRLQKVVQDGLVLVNKKNQTKHYKVLAGDELDVNFEDFDVQASQPDISPNKNVKFEIISEDDNYIIINKPAGLIIHPSESHPEPDTLVNGLLARFPEIAEVGEDSLRPGIVHRLDKEVSGLLAVTKTQPAFLDLKEKFEERKIYKEYIALVHGVPSKAKDEITFSIARSDTSGKMAARPDDSGRPAKTEYEIIEKYDHFSLLKVVIHTGRTHQIRVHLNAIGHPVVGDNLYRPKKLKAELELDRIFLHSHKLEFEDLFQHEMHYIAQLPKELKTLLNSLD